MRLKQISLALVAVLITGSLWANDPTRPDIVKPAGKVAKAIQNLRLTMVRMSDTKPSATINGRLLYVGDSIGGYRVSSISAKQVLLTNNKGQLRLNLITKGALRKSS